MVKKLLLYILLMIPFIRVAAQSLARQFKEQFRREVIENVDAKDLHRRLPASHGHAAQFLPTAIEE